MDFTGLMGVRIWDFSYTVRRVVWRNAQLGRFLCMSSCVKSLANHGVALILRNERTYSQKLLASEVTMGLETPTAELRKGPYTLQRPDANSKSSTLSPSYNES